MSSLYHVSGAEWQINGFSQVIRQDNLVGRGFKFVFNPCHFKLMPGVTIQGPFYSEGRALITFLRKTGPITTVALQA